MNSLILRVTARLLITLLMIFSLVLLMRGHDHPGGGFAGGLVATTAWALYSLAFGASATRTALRYDPRTLMGAGLLISLSSGIISLVFQKPFLTSLWTTIPMGPFAPIKLGSPFFFDLGVYLVVLGVVLNIILSIEEEE